MGQDPSNAVGRPSTDDQEEDERIGECARAFAAHVRELVAMTGLGLRRLQSVLPASASSISRYQKGERLPRKAFLDALLAQVDHNAREPLTNDVRRVTYALYVQALDERGDATQRHLYDLQCRLERHEDELADNRLETEHLRRRAEESGADRPANPTDRDRALRRGAELVRRRAAILAERADLQEEIDRLERSLPPDPDEYLPTARTPRPASSPPSVPPGGRPPGAPVAPGRQGNGPILIAVALALALGITLGVHFADRLGNEDTPTAAGTAAATTTVTATVTAPTPSSPATPPPAPTSAPTDPQVPHPPSGSTTVPAVSPPPTTRLLSSLQADGELKPGPFRLAGRDYPDSLYVGCALSEGSNVTDFYLSGKYKRLTATLGITAKPDKGGAVGTFRLKADGRPLDSWTATRDRTTTIDVDVTGVERLTLENTDLVGVLYCSVQSFVWGDPTLIP